MQSNLDAMNEAADQALEAIYLRARNKEILYRDISDKDIFFAGWLACEKDLRQAVLDMAEALSGALDICEGESLGEQRWWDALKKHQALIDRLKEKDK